MKKSEVGVLTRWVVVVERSSENFGPDCSLFESAGVCIVLAKVPNMFARWISLNFREGSCVNKFKTPVTSPDRFMLVMRLFIRRAKSSFFGEGVEGREERSRRRERERARACSIDNLV